MKKIAEEMGFNYEKVYKWRFEKSRKQQSEDEEKIGADNKN